MRALVLSRSPLPAPPANRLQPVAFPPGRRLQADRPIERCEIEPALQSARDGDSFLALLSAVVQGDQFRSQKIFIVSLACWSGRPEAARAWSSDLLEPSEAVFHRCSRNAVAADDVRVGVTGCPPTPTR